MYTWEPSTEIGREARTEFGGYSLFLLSPNPGHGTFTVQFEVPFNVLVNLSVHDIAGRLVMETSPTMYSAGTHQLQFSGLSTGIYLCRMVSDFFTQSRYIAIVN